MRSSSTYFNAWPSIMILMLIPRFAAYRPSCVIPFFTAAAKKKSPSPTSAPMVAGPRRRQHVFEGVIPSMERRYRDSESNIIREELARHLNTQPCNTCDGSRLRLESRNVFLSDLPLHHITAIPVEESLAFFEELDLPGRQGEIATKIVKEIANRLRFLINVGLEYLTLDRAAETLSGGEGQRIRLASQIGSGLVGVMYILDEPSIGLHQRDNTRLLDTLIHLRDLGNTIVVIEHDEEAIRSADHVVDLGPGAGALGGTIVVAGSPRPGHLPFRFLNGWLPRRSVTD